jgi:hypothetical protein
MLWAHAWLQGLLWKIDATFRWDLGYKAAPATRMLKRTWESTTYMDRKKLKWGHCLDKGIQERNGVARGEFEKTIAIFWI